MALKAGRVGVAPDQVDEFGMVKSEATSGYTKQEADAKFETQTAAAAALAEKQPIQLSVPIELLSGSALTVEDALQGLNNEVTNIAVVQMSACTDIITGASVAENRNYLFKSGNVVQLLLQLSDVITTTAWVDTVCNVPAGFRPKVEFRSKDYITDNRYRVATDGNISMGTVLAGNSVLLSATWITD